MCRRGTCACRPARSSSPATSGEGVSVYLAGACVLCWRFFTGSRLLPELPTSKPRTLARSVHATVRGLSVALPVGLCWDWRITLAVTGLALTGVSVAGIVYRHRTRPRPVPGGTVYAGRAYTSPRAEIRGHR